MALASAATVLGPAGRLAADTPSDLVKLDVFTVSTDKDEGFVANSSLAGGRLAGELKNTPAAYSVLTRDFIDALQLNDLATAVNWTVNATTVPDDGRNAVFGDELSTNFRGLSSTRQQRNFFPFYVNFDSFDLERFDFGRGPNSILFGNGSLAGTANAVTKEAKLDRQFAQFSQTIGSWDYYRTTADINRSIGRDYAVRVDALWQDAKSWRDHDFDKRKGLFLTNSWQLTPSTKLRLEGEYGYSSRQQSLTTIGDNVSGWDGKTTFTGRLAATPQNADQTGITRGGNNLWVYAPSTGLSGIVSWTGMANTRGGNATAAVPVNGQLVAGSSANVQNAPILYAVDLPDNRFDRAIAGSKFHLFGQSYSIAPDAPLYTQAYKETTLFLNQRLSDTLVLQLSGNLAAEKRTTEFISVRGLTNTTIDINQNLPTGAPNPEFLEPYNESVRYRNIRGTNDANLLAALAYNKETGFGTFTANVLSGYYRDQAKVRLFAYDLRMNADPRQWITTDLVRYRYYWDQVSRPLSDIGTTQLTDATGATTTVHPGWALDTTRGDITQNTLAQLRYIQSAGRASLFNHRLDLLGAVRVDHYETSTQVTQATGDYASTWDGVTPQFKPAAPADYATLTYIPKDAAGNPIGPVTPAQSRPRLANGQPQPQYASDRFQDDYSSPVSKDTMPTMSIGSVAHLTSWMSVFANYAETFNPPTPGFDIYGKLFQAQVSKGTDLGLRFNLMNDRVNITIDHYLGQEKHNAVQPVVAGDINSIIRANAIGDLSSAGRNIRGFNDVPGVFYDSRKRSSEGWELETVANLSKSWRLLLNGSIAHAYQSDAFPATRAWLATYDPMLRQILADAGVIVRSDNAALVDIGVPIAQRSPDAATAAAAWNDLQAVEGGFVTGRQKVVGATESTLNLFTDYTFRSGWLNRVRIGYGINYRGKTVIGYRNADTIVDPNNPSSAIDDPRVDAYTAVYRGGYALSTATLGYQFKVGHQDLLLNLVVTNLMNFDKPLYYNTTLRPPGGDLTNPSRVTVPYMYSYVMPRSYRLTATIKF